MCIYTLNAKRLDFSITEHCVCFNLRWVTRAMTQFFDAELRRHGIRPTQGTNRLRRFVPAALFDRSLRKEFQLD